MKALYWKNKAFGETTDFKHIKHQCVPLPLLACDLTRSEDWLTRLLFDAVISYYYSHPQINPTRVVPLGPKEDIEPL